MYFVIFILCFGISIALSTTTTTPPTTESTTTQQPQQQYVVPEATIVILEPKGFTVSIPKSSDDETLFAFHGNINKPLENLEAGQFSQDILRSKNGQWIFIDTTTKLKPGDVINYWTYVINTGIGYRRDQQQYVVPGYAVPMAKIDVHEPKGFSVSIPNSPGVTLYAFHGNINMPINLLEAGQFSKDINAPENNRWTFTDTETKLKAGDVINYWTYVINNGLGYRRDQQQYIVPKYIVPMAKIDVHKPKGFSVSIPNSPGVTLFAFHGNINMPINLLEGGQFSKDINTPANDKWTFTDTETELNAGDVINYWTYVVMDGLGYRNDAQQYVVQDADIVQPNRDVRSTVESIESTTPLNDQIIHENCSDKKMTIVHQHYHHFDAPPKNLIDMLAMPHNAPAAALTTPAETKSSSIITTTPMPCENNEKVIRLRNQLRDTIEKYQDFYDRAQNLETKVESLNEVISELINDRNIGTKLLLRSDDTPADSTMVDAVRSVIEEKLRLPDLSRTIVVARKSRENNGIIFETNSSIDKLRILTRANDRLKNSKIRIYDV